VLLHELLLGDGELVAEQEVFERVAVQDVVRVQRVALYFEVKTVIAGAQPVLLPVAAMKTPERLAGVGQVPRFQAADRPDHVELRQLVEAVQLAHALLGKSDLIHGGWGGALAAAWSRKSPKRFVALHGFPVWIVGNPI
jgi:hypothetical protein